MFNQCSSPYANSCADSFLYFYFFFLFLFFLSVFFFVLVRYVAIVCLYIFGYQFRIDKFILYMSV